MYTYKRLLKSIIKRSAKEKNKLYLNKVKRYYTRNNKRIKVRKKELEDLFNQNKDIRILRQEKINKYNIVSIFESTLTRVLNIPIDSLSTDLIIVTAYFFDVLKDIVKNGFIYNGEKYICLTASAGQIRKKKTVYIKENLLKKYSNTITCGLTLEHINAKGGINVNKYLAYTALNNSATDIIENFDINKTIVVSDMETDVEGTVDFINDKNYEIERRKNIKIPVPHTDGCGMILPSFSKKNMMIRLPWVKGLLISFPFDKFIKKADKEDPDVTHSTVVDIYGQEHDIIKENIQIIFTKSQFKMYKYYSSWSEYQTKFIKYHCQAGKCNEEEDNFDKAKINYQMLQTLIDMKDEELINISNRTIKDIKDIGSNMDTMLRVLGVSTYRENKNFLQKSLKIYPEMLQDNYCKEVIRDIKKSIVKQGRAGRIIINGTYTFIAPDLYAFCENLFLGDKNPKGLLENGEVSCKIFKEYKELDCLRSPHLYMEHAVRKNIVNEKISEWFTTNALYTSCHDLISKILMFDVDGDKSLVCADSTIIEVAKRNIENNNIVPLYYDMKKAEPTKINSNTIYKGLISAYKGGNIGMISNNITKIWNSNDGDLEEKLKVIKWLCMENNFTIDYAKTLYKPVRPKKIDKIIKKYTSKKVPHFFIYAKDKNKSQVEQITNNTMDKLENIIPNSNITFKKLGISKFNYKKLMYDNKIELNSNIINMYNKLDKKKPFFMNKKESKDIEDSNIIYLYKEIKEKLITIGIQELRNNFEDDKVIFEEEKSLIAERYVTDVLVKYLYNEKNTRFKTTLWACFGKTIYMNLKHNLKGTKLCKKCKKRIEHKSPKQKYCPQCAREINIQKTIENRRKKRESSESV
ncbi:hypothetical protein ACFHWD_03920 [Clostridium sp. MT-14]|uniref:hypothetical protein n=1 Tax=Clostridium sp. MT-14 TaxID=3348360 RepID=UPI0035F4885C